MDLIKITDAAQVKAAYTKLGVNEKRIESVDQKFARIPKDFKALGLIAVDLDINGKILKNVPAIAINNDGSKYVLVGSFMAAYTATKKPVQIKKAGSNHGKWMVVNSAKVNAFAEGLSEAEVVAYVIGKEFVASNGKDFPVFQPMYNAATSAPEFPQSEAEALARILPKSYQVISEK